MPVYNSQFIEIDAKETRRYAGLARASFDEAAILSACEEAALLSSPRGVWEEYAYDCARQTVLSDEPFEITGRSIERHLAGAERLIFLAATVGEEIEKSVTKHFDDGQYSHSVLLDAAATAAVEQICDGIERAIRPGCAARGYAMLPRFSPGYGDWDIRSQPSLIRLSGAGRIGITITDAFMLVPRKSVTAVIGLVRNSGISRKKRNCTNCDKINCLARIEQS